MNILDLIKTHFLAISYFAGSAPAPIPTPPPVAPEPETDATLDVPTTPAEKKKAQTKGAKSLQIPLGTIGGDSPLNI